jgi:hypothetical protein
MYVNRFADLRPYQSPGHRDMRMLRMQGREAGPSDVMWLGVSQILPGGGIDPSASPEEKFYVVLEGSLVVETPDGTVEAGVLGQLQDCPGRNPQPKERHQSDCDRAAGDAAPEK